jgi:hypothetical protein
MNFIFLSVTGQMSLVDHQWGFVVECDVEYDVWKMIVMPSSERFGDDFFWAFFLLQ